MESLELCRTTSVGHRYRLSTAHRLHSRHTLTITAARPTWPRTSLPWSQVSLPCHLRRNSQPQGANTSARSRAQHEGLDWVTFSSSTCHSLAPLFCVLPLAGQARVTTDLLHCVSSCIVRYPSDYQVAAMWFFYNRESCLGLGMCLPVRLNQCACALLVKLNSTQSGIGYKKPRRACRATVRVGSRERRSSRFFLGCINDSVEVTDGD